ncbi:uncharacterized protein MONBRDRAFT_38308 [Monosiga brevicollis MX1]|uniref:UBA domain-containing protein n=1 Tax=Monosiga brevicollis TaxID=81824 RepID=A9V6X1_MONBE|nr:uncharacterized protein MONBRDRAFT_38308 [Monosiga brevicollis MX1]EDQ86618.1 predicted protein [Monosiga brevicollis MX1]|eukprot:XP_001748454.1 hypothetical protein [Monosiga brevicollis MX1]
MQLSYDFARERQILEESRAPPSPPPLLADPTPEPSSRAASPQADDDAPNHETSAGTKLPPPSDADQVAKNEASSSPSPLDPGQQQDHAASTTSKPPRPPPPSSRYLPPQSAASDGTPSPMPGVAMAMLDEALMTEAARKSTPARRTPSQPVKATTSASPAVDTTAPATDDTLPVEPASTLPASAGAAGDSAEDSDEDAADEVVVPHSPNDLLSFDPLAVRFRRHSSKRASQPNGSSADTVATTAPAVAAPRSPARFGRDEHINLLFPAPPSATSDDGVNISHFDHLSNTTPFDDATLASLDHHTMLQMLYGGVGESSEQDPTPAAAEHASAAPKAADATPPASSPMAVPTSASTTKPITRPRATSEDEVAALASELSSWLGSDGLAHASPSTSNPGEVFASSQSGSQPTRAAVPKDSPAPAAKGGETVQDRLVQMGFAQPLVQSVVRRHGRDDPDKLLSHLMELQDLLDRAKECSPDDVILVTEATEEPELRSKVLAQLPMLRDMGFDGGASVAALISSRAASMGGRNSKEKPLAFGSFKVNALELNEEGVLKQESKELSLARCVFALGSPPLCPAPGRP